jgi:hypothetical protein
MDIDMNPRPIPNSIETNKQDRLEVKDKIIIVDDEYEIKLSY